MSVWEPADQLNRVIVCRDGDGGDPVAQVMGPSARRYRAAGSALYRVTFTLPPHRVVAGTRPTAGRPDGRRRRRSH